jgi:hypothetical protein
MLISQSSLQAASPVDHQVDDVELGTGGLLSGHVVDAAGLAVPGVAVTIRSAQHDVAQVVTDSEGRFVLSSFRAGAYELSAGQSTQLVRVWAPLTAPPAARDSALVVWSNDGVRAQNGSPGLGRAGSLLAVAGLLGIITGAVIWYDEAHEDDDDSASPVSP